MKYAVVIWLVFLVIGMAGWVMNVAKLISMFHDPSVTPMLVMRIVGVVAAPLGSILGWF